MASKRRIRRNACGDKRKYQTKEAALLTTYILRKKQGKMRAYKCKWCNFFHIGH